MTRTTLLFTVLVASLASAQDLGLYNRALSAFNSGNFEDAAQLFFEVNNATADPDLRMKSEYYLASSFQKKGMLATQAELETLEAVLGHPPRRFDAYVTELLART